MVGIARTELATQMSLHLEVCDRNGARIQFLLHFDRSVEVVQCNATRP